MQGVHVQMKTPQTTPDLDNHAMLCHYAAEKLKSCGFVLGYVSRKSEACYYSLAGYRGYLRIATHPFSRNEAKEIEFSHKPTIAALTFSRGTKFNTIEAVDNQIIIAVGRYMLGQMTSALKKKQYAPKAKEAHHAQL